MVLVLGRNCEVQGLWDGVAVFWFFVRGAGRLGLLQGGVEVRDADHEGCSERWNCKLLQLSN